MSGIDDLLAQYEKNTKPSTPQISSEERLKRYFTPMLDDKKETTKQIKIRLLPAKPGEKLAPEVYFHDIKVDDKKVKLFDPKQDGKRSPLNEVYDGLIATGREDDKKLAGDYRSRKFYILKVIDRNNESHGPKFWRFKHAIKGDGIMDKIIPIIRSKGDITDIKEGRDLTLTLVLATSPTGQKYTTITSIIPEDKEPLTDNVELLEEWTSNELTWVDVYPKKSEEFLDMVAQGEVPMWDKVTSKLVSKTAYGKTEEVTYESTKQTTKKKEVMVDPQGEEDPDSDLPF